MNCFIFKFSLVAIFSLVLTTNCQNVNISDEDFNRTSPEYIESRGFQYEKHTIITTDGYILNIFRIVNPHSEPDHISPVLLWHGVGGNSDSWLISRPGILNSDGIYSEDNNTVVNDCNQNLTSTLSFTLAACGYDVWLANSRGGRYSNKHINPILTEQNPLYSDYTLTELALYDIPAVVKYILKVTKEDSLSYIGHSMGTTTMFILLSLKPDYQQYIKPFIAMAPVVYLGDVKASISQLAPIEPIARPLLFPLGLDRTTAHYLAAYLCNNDITIDECIEILFDSSFGSDPYNLDRGRVPIYLSNSYDKISIRVYLHFAQLINSGDFQAFNYPTKAENILRYGQSTPPNYPLNNIISDDIILIKGENDYLSDDKDIEKLVKQLKAPIKGNYTIEWEEWNHCDYIWGIHANIYLNHIVLRILNDVNDVNDLTDNIYYNQIDLDNEL